VLPPEALPLLWEAGWTPEELARTLRGGAHLEDLEPWHLVELLVLVKNEERRG
jgi:hypothetical protein